jgi:hypothetical protein
VVKKRQVVVRSAPQKPCRLIPIQDHKRRGPTVSARGARRTMRWGRT